MRNFRELDAALKDIMVNLYHTIEDAAKKYGFEGKAIVTMAEVTEYLYNREHNGRVVINDEIKAAIDKYYEEYGCK